MSRTIRRKGIKNLYPYRVEISRWNGREFTWGVHDWEWHSDKYSWRGTAWKKAARAYSNYRRKIDERKVMYKLFKEPEYDYYDLEKQYLGHIWFFD